MIKIEKLKAICYSNNKEGLVKTYRIQEEIFEYENYLLLSFLNSENKEIQIETDKLWRANLTEFRFSRDELRFLSKTYQFKIAERKWGDKLILTASNNELNPLYGLGGDILLLEDNNIEYAIIRFRRWEMKINLKDQMKIC